MTKNVVQDYCCWSSIYWPRNWVTKSLLLLKSIVSEKKTSPEIKVKYKIPKKYAKLFVTKYFHRHHHPEQANVGDELKLLAMIESF
ncbi:hypothetical protein BpHYR1_000650 [Brachionus plicatilis]|uniref:Uncharacterized protein n=1 Tax=Brachionus plicatilis TaxID=10195 RepID=A0A3M7SHC8_BRAPC|nr:hypothetical protein BpHYR1_000650 [Brachionus plicatilis]